MLSQYSSQNPTQFRAPQQTKFDNLKSQFGSSRQQPSKEAAYKPLSNNNHQKTPNYGDWLFNNAVHKQQYPKPNIQYPSKISQSYPALPSKEVKEGKPYSEKTFPYPSMQEQSLNTISSKEMFEEPDDFFNMMQNAPNQLPSYPAVPSNKVKEEKLHSKNTFQYPRTPDQSLGTKEMFEEPDDFLNIVQNTPESYPGVATKEIKEEKPYSTNAFQYPRTPDQSLGTKSSEETFEEPDDFLNLMQYAPDQFPSNPVVPSKQPFDEQTNYEDTAEDPFKDPSYQVSNENDDYGGISNKDSKCTNLIKDPNLSWR